MKKTQLFLALFCAISTALAWTNSALSAEPQDIWGHSSGDSSKMNFSIKANFKELFAKIGKLKVPAGRQSSREQDAFVKGVLSYEDQDNQSIALPVSVRVRGHITQQSCTFPKLELEFESNATIENTLFAGNLRIKIGTHCIDSGPDSAKPFGANDQKNVNREVFAYRLANLLGLPSLKTREATITYIDIGNPDSVAGTITRTAALIESTSSYKDRLGVAEIFTESSDQYKAALEQAKAKGKQPKKPFKYALDTAEMADAKMVLLAMAVLDVLGWYDHTVDLDQVSNGYMWNIKAFQRKDGSRYILPIDFNLSPFVDDRQTPFTLRVFEAHSSQFPEVAAAIRLQIKNQGPQILKALDEADLSYIDPTTGKVILDEDWRKSKKQGLEKLFSEL